MSAVQQTRRHFLVDSARTAALGWLAAQLPLLASLSSCAREDAIQNKAFTSLTTGEGRAMRAFAAQIIPSDSESPGAEEAGAVYFIDRALTLPFFVESVPVIRGGLADLDGRARLIEGKASFASLGGAQQIAIMRQIEQTPFFSTARTLVVIGTFADPSHGGNRNRVGWTMIGIDHRPSYAPPFGWYDAQVRGDAVERPTA
jgi:gluconate 2-dehydrogenase gamma chain